MQRLAVLARARLAWERFAPVFAVSAAALAVFVILSWLGLWEVAGDPLRLFALGLVLVLLVRASLRARFRHWPTRSEALRRLEETAGLSHRPLDALRDAPALSPDLWPRHVARARTDAESVRRVGRVPALTPLDRYGLRIILPIALVATVIVAGGLAPERLRRALSPSLLPFVNPYALEFEAWVEPPEYTGLPPLYVQGDDNIRAPVGSTLVVRASGASDLPRPRFIGPDGTRFLDPAALGRNSVEARTVVDGSGLFDWRIGPLREAYRVDAQPDALPSIELKEEPEADDRDRLVLVFDASDDYGVERIVLEMVELEPGLDVAVALEADPAQVDAQMGGFKDAEGRSLAIDLTRHPLSGRKVAARLVAVDGAGQRGASEPFYTTVPDRIFVEPLAKAIIEQRALILSGAGDYAPLPDGEPDNDASDGTFDTYQTAWRMDRAPEPVQRAVSLMEAVTDYPDPTVFNDPVVYLGLRHAARSVRYARSESDLSGLPEHLWKLANRAEFGVLGTALQEMQEAQEALREGIARRAPEREIDTLFDRYNQAVDAYMEELRRNATVAEEGGGGGPPMGSTDEIQELLDAIEEANRNGDTEGARRALAQLAELLENLQMQISPKGGGEGEGSSEEMSEEMREQLEELADLLGEQRELQDQTRQAEREELRRRFGEELEESVSPQELAERQRELEALIDGLGEQAQGGDELGTGEDGPGGTEPGREGSQPGEGDTGGTEPGEGETPGSGGETGEGGPGGNAEGEDAARALGRASDAMQRSEQALAGGDLGTARLAQDEAIDALRRAGDALAREIGEQDQDGEGVDALGRDADGLASDNAESDIDTRSNAERSREILEELRRRASEAEREQQERDYLDRLLRRF